MKKSIFLFFIFLFVLIQCKEVISENRKIEIPDISLKQAILEELGVLEKDFKLSKDASVIHDTEEKTKADIYQSQVKNLTQLVTWIPINDLKGIEYCENLEKMHMDYALLISDISPLSYLPSLKELKITHIMNKDFRYDELSKLEKLESLHISGIHDENFDLNLIVNLTNLKTLIIDNFKLSDLMPLLTLHKNGGFKKGSCVKIRYNGLDFRQGTSNREVVDKLIEAGVEVIYKEGNIIE